MRIRSVAIIEDEKNEIREYLLGLLAEADEERVELRLMSDAAFSEEFDILVDEIATHYVMGHFTGDEKTRVEQYFLRSPERRLKVQFMCALLRQVGEKKSPSPPYVNLWQRFSSLWVGFPVAYRTAISFATVLIVAGVVFWVISLNSNPTFASFELSMSTSQRDTGTPITTIPSQSGIDEWRIKLNLPTPTAPQYRASLRGEGVSLPQLAIEAQDAESITVRVPADQIRRGTYVIELKEVSQEGERPLRDAYVFAIN